MAEKSAVTLEEWKMFKASLIWRELEEDMVEREKVLMSDLRVGRHEVGTDDQLRARLSELEFLQTSVDARIEILSLAAEEKEKENEQAGN